MNTIKTVSINGELISLALDDMTLEYNVYIDNYLAESTQDLSVAEERYNRAIDNAINNCPNNQNLFY